MELQAIQKDRHSGKIIGSDTLFQAFMFSFRCVSFTKLRSMSLRIDSFQNGVCLDVLVLQPVWWLWLAFHCGKIAKIHWVMATPIFRQIHQSHQSHNIFTISPYYPHKTSSHRLKQFPFPYVVVPIPVISWFMTPFSNRYIIYVLEVPFIARARETGAE